MNASSSTFHGGYLNLVSDGALSQEEYHRTYHSVYIRRPRSRQQQRVRNAGQRRRYAASLAKRNATKHTFGKGAGLHFSVQLQKQKYRCAICNILIDASAHLDHNHNNKKTDPAGWRGALCASCNKGLGFFKDNTAILQQARDYLQFWGI